MASGKGGVGKSTVTVNLACSLAEQGLKVGIIDADVHGFSVPDLMGITDTPTRLDEMILPPVTHEVKTISIGMFVEPGKAVAWRGPMVHRAGRSSSSPMYTSATLMCCCWIRAPGTGDIAISVAQLLPGSELLVATTPQAAAASVAERAGALSTQTNQKVAGVVENMAPMTMPDGSVMDLFGSGGGQLVADRLSTQLETDVPLLGSVPLDPTLRQPATTAPPRCSPPPTPPPAPPCAALPVGSLASRAAYRVGGCRFTRAEFPRGSRPAAAGRALRRQDARRWPEHWWHPATAHCGHALPAILRTR